MSESENHDSDPQSEPESEPFQDSGSEYVNSERSESTESDGSQSSSESEVTPENNTENNTEDTIVDIRKRKRSKGKNVNSSNWERNKNKLKRMKGEHYTTIKLNKNTRKYDKVDKESRKMGPACNCNISGKSKKFYCKTFSEDERQSIFDNFWQNLDWNGKKIYITGLVDTAPVKFHRNGNIFGLHKYFNC